MTLSAGGVGGARGAGGGPTQGGEGCTAKLEPWGLPEVVPKQIVTPEGAKVSGQKRGRGVGAPDADDSDDLHANDTDDEEEEELSGEESWWN